MLSKQKRISMTQVKDAERTVRRVPAWLPWGLLGIFAVVLIVSGIMLKNTSKPPVGVAAAAVPSSIRPTQKEVDNYTVGPGLPKYISIPSIKVQKTRVRGLGLKAEQIISPSNVYDTGWYTGSSRPGQKGAMFIFGHVSSWSANGIFHNLKKLRPGDQVKVTRGDDRVFTYQVVSTKIYPADKVDMAAVLSPVDAKQGLNLMTCTGSVMKDTNEFSERLVVFTKFTH